MNIFEQYGIKEVADCTLYSIALDKYDNEIYIPVMYFDTLKISSMEQSVSSTSAKGGYKNSELITWDFGKEITVNLTDALYTPASLSLLWGGRFGTSQTEINGFWNPIHREIELSFEMETMSQFKEYLDHYETVLNEIYQIIQNSTNFLRPHICLLTESTVMPNENNIFHPAKIFEITGNYFPLETSEKEQIYKEYQKRIGNYTNEEYSIFYRLNFEYKNGAVTSEEKPQYYLDIQNCYERDGAMPNLSYISGATPQWTFNQLMNNKNDELITFLHNLSIYGGYNISPDVYAIKPEDWKYFLNKTEFDFKTLIKSCRRILYYYMMNNSEYNDYSVVSALLPIDFLENNYEIIDDGNNQYIHFLYELQNIHDESKVMYQDIYTYTSKYLGQDKDKIKYPYILNINEEPVEYGCNLFLPRVQKIGQPAERAKLVLKNFGDFSVNIKKEGIQYNSYYLLHEVGHNGTINFNSQERNTFYDYEWKDCEIEMLSLEGQQDVYYANHIDILLRVNSADYSKKILLKGNNEEDYYNSQLDFYNKDQKVGTFYINDTFNSNIEPENSLYPIKSGINELVLIDRLEKCKATQDFCIDTTKNFESNVKKDLPQYKQVPLTIFLNPKTMKPYQSNCNYYIKRNGEAIYGNLCQIKKNEIYYKWTRAAAGKNESLGNEIIVTGYDFPGTYKLVANTYTRSRTDGSDSRLQIEIPLCKIIPESTIELSADGSPVVFDMQLKVMKNELGEMVKIQKYDVESKYYDEYKSGSTTIKALTSLDKEYECQVCNTPKITFTKESDIVDMEILLPRKEDYYCFAIDCLPPFNTKESYLMFPKTNEQAKELYHLLNNTEISKQEKEQLLMQARNQLLVMVPLSETIIYIDKNPYLIANQGGYEYYEISEQEEETAIINGIQYRIAFITQENIDRFSPITFTITGVVEE